MKKITAKIAYILCAVLCIMSVMTGCGRKTSVSAEQSVITHNVIQDADTVRVSEEKTEIEADSLPQSESDSAGEPENLPETVIDRDGSYTSKEDVALYLHTYGELPSNFITKKEAKALGWSGGRLEEYAPGKCIGGDHFGNYEELLPDADYHECDIGTLGKKSRGQKRIIWDDDGNIYYTEDHYESFTKLY